MKLYEVPANVNAVVIHRTYGQLGGTSRGVNVYRQYTTKKENTFHETVYDPVAYHNDRNINHERYGLSHDALETIMYFTWRHNSYTFTDGNGWFLIVPEEKVKTLAQTT